MKSVNYILFFILLCLSGCSGLPVQQKLLQSMAQFDQAAIPLLVMAQLDKQREAEIALGRFKNTWNSFYGGYYGLKITYGLNIVDKHWKEDLDQINALVISSEGSVKAHALRSASTELKEIREVFWRLRKRNGWKYFLDGMTEFCWQLDQMETVIRGKNKLAESELKQLRVFVASAENAWKNLPKTSVGNKHFNFTKQKIQAIKGKILAETPALGLLRGAVSAGHPEEIMLCCEKIKSDWLQIYRAFGDFDPIFKQIKEENNKQSEKRLSNSQKQDKAKTTKKEGAKNVRKNHKGK